MDEELRSEILEDWTKVHGSKPEDIEYFDEQYTNAVRFGNGRIYLFEKPRIKTDFCFGHGQNGISTEEEYGAARKECEATGKKRNFFRANIEENFPQYGMLEKDAEGYDRRNPCSVMCYRCGKICGLASDFWEEEHYHPDQKPERLTETDKTALREMLDEEKAKFLKRLEAYWKRYGASKLRTWTYLVD